MKRFKQVLLFLVIFVGLPFGGLALLWKDRCKETRLGEEATSDGSVVAARIATDCGKVMKVATEIRLERRTPAGVVDSATVLVLAGSTEVPLHWSDGPTLTIDLPTGVDVVQHKTEWQGVTVAYTNIPAPVAR